MEEAPSVDAVHLAVHTLHHAPDPQHKEKASLWLDRLQKSIHSWKLSDELLHRKLDVESCYFGAQTMRSKIRHSFHELPLDAHASLRDSLLEHVSAVTPATDKAIVTQLCVAVADLAMQMRAWPDPVDDLVERFADINASPLLEILTVLPEEADSDALRLGENRRDQLRRYLAAKFPTVEAFLAASPSTEAVKCLRSWIAARAFHPKAIDESLALAHAFRALEDPNADPQLQDAAADCVCALLQRLDDSDFADRRIFDAVASLEKRYHLAVAHEDADGAINYARIFTELAESFLVKLVNEDGHFALESLNLVLTCVGHHDYEVAEVSFNLWYRLSEELYAMNDDAASARFRPYVERLLSALCRHCQMEPDHRDLLGKDDDFYGFREKVSELTKDVVFIIGSINCFKQFFLSIQTPDASWERIEAALFIMQAVAKNIVPEEMECVPRVIEAILGMPDTAHIAVKHTSILLLGELCEWIEKHPQCIQAVFEYLLSNFKNPLLASTVSHSLQTICSACRHHMTDQLPELLLIVRNLDSFGLSNSAAIQLLRGVASVIGYVPLDQVTNIMIDACTVQIAPLVSLNNQNLVVSQGGSSDPSVWLDRIAAIFRYCKLNVPNGQPHPCLLVVNELWPIFSNTMDKYSADLRIMERLCRCLRFVVRFIGKQAVILFEPLSKKMIATYLMYRHSCFLYLASILIDEFYTDPTCIFGLLEMLQSLVVPALELLQVAGLVQHPDTVDDMFRLCDRFLQRAPMPFVQCTVVDPILQCGILACSLDHKDANSSVMKFFTDFVHKARPSHHDYENGRDVYNARLLQHGDALVTNLLHASVFSLHGYMVHDVAGVFYEMLKWDSSFVKVALKNALEALTQKSAAATSAQIMLFHTSVTDAENERCIVDAIRDFVRLYQ